MDTTTAHALGSDIQIVDVREDDEWAAGRIEGAVHVPLAELPSRMDELDDRRTLVTVCRSGGRSNKAHSLLAAAGKMVENLDGGMQAWAKQGLPLAATGNRPGRVI